MGPVTYELGVQEIAAAVASVDAAVAVVDTTLVAGFAAQVAALTALQTAVIAELALTVEQLTSLNSSVNSIVSTLQGMGDLPGRTIQLKAGDVISGSYSPLSSVSVPYYTFNLVLTSAADLAFFQIISCYRQNNTSQTGTIIFYPSSSTNSDSTNHVYLVNASIQTCASILPFGLSLIHI